MKKLLLTLFAMLAFSPLALASAPTFSPSNTTNTNNSNYWFNTGVGIAFGTYPNADIYYDGTNLVLDVLHGGGKVSIPDGVITTITGNITGNVTGNLTGNVTGNVTGNITGNLSTGTVATGNNAITDAKVNAAGGSATALGISGTLGIMDGSDTYNGIAVDITNADHTGASNFVNGVEIGGITADAQATETAIKIGNGWDVGLNAGNNSITTSGAIAGGAVSGTSLASTGTIKSSNATGVGAHVISGANTACNTTCSSGGCLFGFDLAGGATAPVIKECTDAASDVCLCMQ